MDHLNFFSLFGELEFSKNRLPHWQQKGAVYFVTWRLYDSIPREKLDQHFEDVRCWKDRNPQPWGEETEIEFHRLFSGRIDHWMDAGFGSCLLRKVVNAEVLKNTLLFFEGERTAMHCFVIMPNHIHALFTLHPDFDIGKIVHSWKRHSAVRINRMENRVGSAFWQKDYFDRLVRDQKHFRGCVKYVRNNPNKARLKSSDFDLWESELAKQIE